MPTDLTWVTDCDPRIKVTATYVPVSRSRAELAEELLLWVPDGGPAVTLTLFVDPIGTILMIDGQYEEREDFTALLGCFEAAREEYEAAQATEPAIQFEMA